MASLWKHKRGGWYVELVLPARTACKIYLGKLTKGQALTIAGHIEHLHLSNARGLEPSLQTLQWLDRIDVKFLNRLRNLGLVRTATVRTDWRLGEWFDEYIKSRKDFAVSTAKGFKTARKTAVSVLGDVLLGEITVMQARQYARDLASQHSSEHASKLVERAKQVLEAAYEARILAENPFKTVVLTSKPDQGRKVYIDKETATAVLDGCAHQHSRALFALARFCGLRVPHEPLAIKWTDVDFDASRLTIPADTKTGGRTLPLFPEARKELLALREITPLDQEQVFDRARSSAATTWRNWLEDAIAKAQLTQWEKLWINLRASCRTDLEKRFTSQVCNAWLGHSTRVAEDHYLLVTPEDWSAACGR